MLTLLSRLLALSVRHRFLVVALTIAVGALGAYNFTRLPIDAVPDITNVQVQINTSVKALSPVEVERQITFPIEWAMGGIPGVQQVRSLSRYGLSQVTVVFEDGTDIYWARQLVAERLDAAKESLPPGLGEPQLGPIATGLGEIYMWTLEAAPDARRPDGQPYDLTDLRTIQDWIVRPQIRTVPGVTEVNSIGGYERLYQVSPDPAKLVGYGLSFRDVLEALAANNANAGGGYIEHKGEQYLVRATGLVQSEDDIRGIIVGNHGEAPIRIEDVAEVGVGRELRTGAATEDGEEAVIGTAIMLVGENGRAVSRRVDEQIKAVNKSLPEGVTVKTVYDRTYLVDAALSTVRASLLEGAALVVVVLFLLLGNLRAALIAALAIPFSMLIAVTAMALGKISGNLMSLGAIDFGLIVDGSVIIVENCVRRFAEEQRRLGRALTREERLGLAYDASQEVRQATIFGELIIAIVYLPILTLTGIEGKMFRPMAQTVVLALAGATILSMTFVPALVALLLTGRVSEKENFLFHHARSAYGRVLAWALSHKPFVVAAAGVVLVASGLVAAGLGREFAPKLSEGALALQPARIPSISLTTSVAMQANAALIFTSVPLALTGCILALWGRGLPISISAAVGFIALSGVAVLNGLVMVTFIENMRQRGEALDDAVLHGSIARLRPVLVTALVAALGFVPMALATGTGSEVQRPLATVVIGGILSSTTLTLVVLPVLYRLTHRQEEPSAPGEPADAGAGSAG